MTNESVKNLNLGATKKFFSWQFEIGGRQIDGSVAERVDGKIHFVYVLRANDFWLAAGRKQDFVNNRLMKQLAANLVYVSFATILCGVDYGASRKFYLILIIW